MAALHSASSRGAASRGCSALWVDCGCSVPSTSASTSGSASTSSAVAQRPAQHVSFVDAAVPPSNSLSTALTLPRSGPLVRDEPLAVRAAEERIACISHVGPHVGPGSGAGLNYTISRLRSQLERLETWRDGPDTDEEEDEEPRMGMIRPHNRLMTYG